MPENWNLEAAHFINLCIRRRPETRLGLNGVTELKSHVWFKDFDWKALGAKKMRAPWKPRKGFHVNARELAQIKVAEQGKSVTEAKHEEELLHNCSFQQLFQGFYFSKEEEIEKERAGQEGEFRQVD